jgi:hypothetical protein
MTTDGSPDDAGRSRSLLGVVRAVPGTTARVEHLEAELVALRRRVDELERSLAAVHAIRDDVRALTESVTEELNRRSAEG